MKTLKAIISILAIAIVFILNGCEVKSTGTESNELTIRPGYAPLKIVKIDGCEYLYGPWGNATVLTHKGNCPNHKDTSK